MTASKRWAHVLTFSPILAKAKAKKIGKTGPIAEKIEFPVESDVNRLVNYVCGSNIYVEGEDIKVNAKVLASNEVHRVEASDSVIA